MKILFDHPCPFLLAHGGVQVQIEATKTALEKIGVEVEWLRWWDSQQTGSLIHFFGVASNSYLHLAVQVKKLPVVITNFFSEPCNRPELRLRLQGWVTRAILRLPLGNGIKQQLKWQVFSRCTHNIVGLEAERRVLELAFRVPRERTSVVPLGVADAFLAAGRGKRNQDYLICVGTITGQKNSAPLARLARQIQIPILFVGKPYSETDACWREFKALIDGRWVRHQAHVADPQEMITLLQQARGAVVASDFENWSLTAHEAAACGLPLLLPAQNWARECFGDQAQYFTGNIAHAASSLREFYNQCPNLPAPNIRHFRWTEIAARLRNIYSEVLKSPAAN